VFSGFVAQEVEQAAKDLGYNFSGVDKPADAGKQTYALRYSDFVVPLVKAVQEQQKIIETQQKQIDEMKKEMDEIKKQKK
jgi:trimeric autotransporter adhesin